MSRYQYEPFLEALESVVKEFDTPEAKRALQYVRFSVLSIAWVEMGVWKKGMDVDVVLSWAWEDMVMAFTGYGSHETTGVVVLFWASIPREKWPDVVNRLNEGKTKSEAATGNHVQRRYLLHYRTQTVRSPEMGFDLPCVLPVFGPRMQDWAEKWGKENGVDPASVLDKIAEIERLDREGQVKLTEKAEEESSPTPPNAPKGRKQRTHLRLVIE